MLVSAATGFGLYEIVAWKGRNVYVCVTDGDGGRFRQKKGLQFLGEYDNIFLDASVAQWIEQWPPEPRA